MKLVPLFFLMLIMASYAAQNNYFPSFEDQDTKRSKNARNTRAVQVVNGMLMHGGQLVVGQGRKIALVSESESNLLRIISIADPNDPKIYSSTTLTKSRSHKALFLTKDEGTLFIVDSEVFKIFNISDVKTPIVLGSYDLKFKDENSNLNLSFPSLTVSLDNSRTIVSFQGIHIFDTSNFSSIKKIYTLEDKIFAVIRLLRDNQTLLVANAIGFKILNISNPNSPVSIGKIPIEPTNEEIRREIGSIAISPDEKTVFLAYFVRRQADNQTEIQSISISSLTNPQILKSNCIAKENTLKPKIVLSIKEKHLYLLRDSDLKVVDTASLSVSNVPIDLIKNPLDFSISDSDQIGYLTTPSQFLIVRLLVNLHLHPAFNLNPLIFSTIECENCSTQNTTNILKCSPKGDYLISGSTSSNQIKPYNITGKNRENPILLKTILSVQISEERSVIVVTTKKNIQIFRYPGFESASNISSSGDDLVISNSCFIRRCMLLKLHEIILFNI